MEVNVLVLLLELASTLFLVVILFGLRKAKAKRIIIASGYFDPIHVGHIEYLRLAKEQGGKLVVILNSDNQCILKKGKPFMDQKEKVEILNSMKFVDEVFISIDEDKSVCKSIEAIAKKYHRREIIFAKGGDRFGYEVPEAKICRELNIRIVDNLGKKIQSSSFLTGLREIKDIIIKK